MDGKYRLATAAAAALLLLAACARVRSQEGGAIDWSRARQLYQREQRGEALSPEDKAYLEKAKAARAAGQRPGAGPAAPGAAGAGIDWAKARDLLQRERRGEKLTPEDKAYLEKAKAEVAAGRGPGAGGPQGAPQAGKESIGLTPLTDMKADQRYKGEDGGLYGGGKNEPPALQQQRAHAAAAQIAPLGADGKPAPDGKVVLLSIGMSNTTQEFSRFKEIADRDREKSPRLVIVDGAQGGQDSEAWATDDPRHQRVWAEADRRIAAAGATAQQVQVLWIKQARIQPAKLGEFPAHAKVLQKDVVTILNRAKARYPNVRLAYLSSRIYGGYAATQLNPEPYAYEGAFSMRWVIQDQVKDDPGLNCDPARGEVKAPVCLWGPYLWADGTKGRQAGDLLFTREDLGGDGTHPSESGRQKVAELLLKFLKSDPYAKGWFLRKPGDEIPFPNAGR